MGQICREERPFDRKWRIWHRKCQSHRKQCNPYVAGRDEHPNYIAASMNIGTSCKHRRLVNLNYTGTEQVGSLFLAASCRRMVNGVRSVAERRMKAPISRTGFTKGCSRYPRARYLDVDGCRSSTWRTAASPETELSFQIFFKNASSEIPERRFCFQLDPGTAGMLPAASGILPDASSPARQT